MQSDWENEKVVERNRLPPRAYFLPNKDKILLNGTWNFSLSQNARHARNLDKDGAAKWSSIEVPGMWQLQGFGTPQYTNSRYPFPVDPPRVPAINPTGVYERSFKLTKSWLEVNQTLVRFEGVDSAFNVIGMNDTCYADNSQWPRGWLLSRLS